MLKVGMRVRITEAVGGVQFSFAPSVDYGLGRGIVQVKESNMEFLESMLRAGRAELLDLPQVRKFYENAYVPAGAEPAPTVDIVDPPAKRKPAKRSHDKSG
jgi:hypothetical protein